jgi:hypothetical protein
LWNKKKKNKLRASGWCIIGKRKALQQKNDASRVANDRKSDVARKITTNQQAVALQRRGGASAARIRRSEWWDQSNNLQHPRTARLALHLYRARRTHLAFACAVTLAYLAQHSYAAHHQLFATAAYVCTASALRCPRRCASVVCLPLHRLRIATVHALCVTSCVFIFLHARASWRLVWTLLGGGINTARVNASSAHLVLRTLLRRCMGVKLSTTRARQDGFCHNAYAHRSFCRFPPFIRRISGCEQHGLALFRRINNAQAGIFFGMGGIGMANPWAVSVARRHSGVVEWANGHGA